MATLQVTRSLRQLSLIVCATLGLVLIIVVAPVAAEADSAIAQGFNSKDSNITKASLVAITKDSTSAVELGSTDSTDRLVGVVSTRPLIQLSNGASDVQVVTSGLTAALVSNINGDIINGDKITSSPIAGVGMKATTSTVVVGIAQGDFKASSNGEERTITDKNGKKQTVKIGQVPIQVGVAYYTIGTESGPSFVPDALQELANAIAGRNVSPVRVIVAGLIILLLFVSVTVTLYSAIRASLISIGRNPLSELAVRKSLAGVGRTLVAVFAFTLLAVYLVLAI